MLKWKIREYKIEAGQKVLIECKKVEMTYYSLIGKKGKLGCWLQITGCKIYIKR